MSAFGEALALLQRGRSARGRRFLFVPYDQLSGEMGPLSREEPRALGIVLVESPWKAAQRPYHKQKLALVLANLRHFALEQAERGVYVRHVVSPGDYAAALEPLRDELGPLRVMRPAERELRRDLHRLVAAGGLEELPHEGFLTGAETFRRSQRGPPYRMDAFYRAARRESGLLMQRGKPEGGKLSFDVENRKAWKGEPPAPPPPRFPRDAIKDEVCALIEQRFAAHPGTLDPDALPATHADAEALWARALRHCLRQFGPYEDAMSTRSATLFHTCVSPLVNLHRLLPARLVGDVANIDAPLASREGFIRQVLGWREFVHHIHEATDGFRTLPSDGPEVPRRPGDGGGAAPSALGAETPLPAAYWGATSGLRCLDTVVREVWAGAYSHHITRLMVLGNLATLLGYSPRELTDWFWAAYQDAYDWVVEPNVLGMATFAAGDLMTTKPYVSGAAYIDRMSDYCSGCAFDPATTCPVTPLYWAFLARNEKKLAGIQRLRMPLASLRKRPAAKRAADVRVLEHVRDTLARGEVLTPDDA